MKGSGQQTSSTPQTHKIVKRFASKDHDKEPKHHEVHHKDAKIIEKKKKRSSQSSLHNHKKRKHFGKEDSKNLAKKVEELEKLVTKVRKDVAIKLESMKNSISVLRNQVDKELIYTLPNICYLI
jgi:hypothetical protein